MVMMTLLALRFVSIDLLIKLLDNPVKQTLIDCFGH